MTCYHDLMVYHEKTRGKAKISYYPDIVKMKKK